MQQFLHGLVVIVAVHETVGSQPTLAPQVPKCPGGYVDQTHGNAYWWGCADNCPGPWPWADRHCGCACVQPHVYREILHERARQAADAAAAVAAPATPAPGAQGPWPGAAADTAPALGTFVAGAPSTTVRPAGGAAGAVGSESPAPLPTGAGGGTVSGAAGQGGAAVTADTEGTAGTAGGGPVSLGPATYARTPTSPVERVEEVTARSRPVLSMWHALTTTAAPASDESGSQGLSSTATVLVSIISTTCFICCLFMLVVHIQFRRASQLTQLDKQPVIVKLVMRCTSWLASHHQDSDATHRDSKRRKLSRVEPMPDNAAKDLPCLCGNLPHPVQCSHPPAQNYREWQIQPPTNFNFNQAMLCPDVSLCSRMQKERVMNGGWHTGLKPPCPSKAGTRSPSLASSYAGSASKPSPPSVASDISTRSPSVPCSSGSTGSKSPAPTPPSLTPPRRLGD